MKSKDLIVRTEDAIDDDGLEERMGRAARNVRNKISLALIAAAVLTIVVLGLLYRSAHSRQVELENELKQQSEQLERLNDVLDTMREEKKANEAKKETVPVITGETLKEELSSLSQLVTQQYVYTNADKYESDAVWIFGWTRPFSSKSILITYDGVIKAGVDLREAVIDVSEEAHTIKITLPKSKITDNNIPQETITVVEAKDGLFNEVTLDNYNEFVSDQKLVMEQKVKDKGFLEEADEEARTIVKSFVSLLPGMENYKLTIE